MTNYSIPIVTSSQLFLLHCHVINSPILAFTVEGNIWAQRQGATEIWSEPRCVQLPTEFATGFRWVYKLFHKVLWKLPVLWLWWYDQITISHMSEQLISRGICKSLTCLWISHKTTPLLHGLIRRPLTLYEIGKGSLYVGEILQNNHYKDTTVFIMEIPYLERLSWYWDGALVLCLNDSLKKIKADSKNVETRLKLWIRKTHRVVG